MKAPSIFLAVCFLILQIFPCLGEELSPEKQKKVNEIIAMVKIWGTDPIIVDAVKAQNAHLPEEYAKITQEQWDALTVLDPVVRGFTKNAVGQFLKSKMTDSLTLANVSDAQGYKVGFVTKSKYWIHKGIPQHEQPLSGKVFQGPITVHPSTGVLQLLLGIPVLDDGKPIGSIIVGVKASALE